MNKMHFYRIIYMSNVVDRNERDTLKLTDLREKKQKKLREVLRWHSALLLVNSTTAEPNWCHQTEIRYISSKAEVVLEQHRYTITILIYIYIYIYH